jgi:hypothetical protein
MTRLWPAIAGWTHAALLAALPWVAWLEPRWAPLVAGFAALTHPAARRGGAAEPWASVSAAASAAVFIALHDGVRGPLWLWLAVGAVVSLAARWLARPDGGRPDAADLAAVVGWAGVLWAEPRLLGVEAGGWLAPAVLLVAARQLGAALPLVGGRRPVRLGPPTREVRGTLSLRGLVATSGGLPATAPIDLDLRAGESLAVLCDEPGAAQALADVVAGRTRPHSGALLVDGSPLEDGDRLVAVVAPGEPFLEGGLDRNLGALLDEPPDRDARAAARDACGLAEVEGLLAGRTIAADGSPLAVLDRLLVLAARALVSHYRLLVVVDAAPWVDLRHGEIWRAALVRASVGRTAVWITDDRELADRADHVHELVEGSLRAS